MSLQEENDDLKAKVKTLKSEVKILKKQNKELQQQSADEGMKLKPETKHYPYSAAVLSHRAYASDDRSWKLYGTTTLLKGFVFDADRVTKYPSRKFFLLPGIKPSETNETDFSGNQITIMVLGLTETSPKNYNIITNHNGPIVYEYLDPCPDTNTNPSHVVTVNNIDTEFLV